MTEPATFSCLLLVQRFCQPFLTPEIGLGNLVYPILLQYIWTSNTTSVQTLISEFQSTSESLLLLKQMFHIPIPDNDGVSYCDEDIVP